MATKKRINLDMLSLPDDLIKIVGNAPIYESSGQSGARTLFIDRDDGLYLKIATIGSLMLASQMQKYFAQHKMSSPVILYLSADRDYMLSQRLNGEDGTTEKYLAEPERLSEVFGYSLRLLHEVNTSDCPVQNRMSELIQTADSTSFKQSHLDDISEYIGIAKADTALSEIKAAGNLLKNDVLIHGDYCLPNMILNNWAFEGFIDVADGGIGDRHYDIAWGLWTLNWNLKTSKYSYGFLNSYGLDYIDRERLRICGLLAAME